MNLTQIHREHAQWLKDHKKGKRADFRGKSLYSEDLSHKDWREAIFDSCDAGHVNLEGCTLVGASFVNANLQGANLKGVIASKTIFMGANLRGATISGANFTDSNFNGADLYGSDARGGVDFSRAEMLRADINKMVTDQPLLTEEKVEDAVKPRENLGKRRRREPEPDPEWKPSDSKVEVMDVHDLAAINDAHQKGKKK